jgi:hypothetical protein
MAEAGHSKPLSGRKGAAREGRKYAHRASERYVKKQKLNPTGN